MIEDEILIHNIAGELASLYVFYINSKSKSIEGDEYNKKVWKNEYLSRLHLMKENPFLIPVLNGYNSFFKKNINQTNEAKRTFFYE
jgi:hypothetical protein